MNTRFFDGIDWQRPWLQPLWPAASAIVQANDWRQALNDAAARRRLRNHRGLPIRFVPQTDLPPGTAYEAFISASGGVPTRENLHDFFNALVWLSFPGIKQKLNALQAVELARAASAGPDVRARRGRVRDAATIFDENAALLVCQSPAWVDALRGHQWHEVFVKQRTAFRQECEVWLFGHALMEKLASPYKAITAHAWPVLADRSYSAMRHEDRQRWLDATVAQALSGGLTTTDFTPLPVSGIPEWWDGQDEAFYCDAAVFRPKRRFAF